MNRGASYLRVLLWVD